jgi:hypothetical protein
VWEFRQHHHDCGNTDRQQVTTTTTAGKTDRQQVTDVVTAYFAAEAKGDLSQACDYLTAGRQAEVVKSADGLPPRNDPQASSCPDALNSILDIPGVREVVSNLEGVGDVTVTGDSAKAVANSTTGDGRNSTTHYILTRTETGWKIAPGSGGTNATALVAPP